MPHGLLIKTVQGGEHRTWGTPLGKMLATMVASVLGRWPARSPSTTASAASSPTFSRWRRGDYDNHGHRAFGYTRDGQPYEPEATMFRAAAADVLEGGSLRGVAPARGTRPA